MRVSSFDSPPMAKMHCVDTLTPKATLRKVLRVEKNVRVRQDIARRHFHLYQKEHRVRSVLYRLDTPNKNILIDLSLIT